MYIGRIDFSIADFFYAQSLETQLSLLLEEEPSTFAAALLKYSTISKILTELSARDAERAQSLQQRHIEQLGSHTQWNPLRND